MDDVYGLPVGVESEQKLEGEELVEHINQCNRRLVEEVKHYHKKCEEHKNRVFKQKAN